MRKGMKLVRVLSLVLCLALSAAFASVALGKGASKQADSLVFSKIVVETSTRTGFFGGRYVNVKVSGSIKNETGNPINSDNLPELKSPDDKNISIKPKMTQEKLLQGETCNITFEKELSVEGSAVPTLAFDGPVGFTGLDDAQAELNEKLKSISEEYAAEDAKAEAERKAREEEEAAAKQKREDDKAALKGFEGKTAREAFEYAETTEYAPKFKDSFDVDVTEGIKKPDEGDPVGSALVTGVQVSDAGWFSSASVTFTLDYVDPVAKQERDDKAAADAARAEVDAALPNCVGMTADDALGLAEQSSYSPSFVDSFGEDVSDDVKNVSNGSEVHETLVTEVTIKEPGWFLPGTVKFTLDYTDPVAKEERDRRAAEEAERKAAAAAKDQAKADLEASTGKSLAEVLPLALEYNESFKFVTEENVDQTAEAKDQIYDKAKERVVVVSVDADYHPPKIVLDRPLALSEEDSEDLKQLLQTKNLVDPSIESFAKDYKYKQIEFDGYVAYVQRNSQHNTRFDYVLVAGDPDKPGMFFQILDSNDRGFDWRGDEPASVANGLKCHFVVEIEYYEPYVMLPEMNLITVKPIETTLL